MIGRCSGGDEHEYMLQLISPIIIGSHIAFKRRISYVIVARATMGTPLLTEPFGGQADEKDFHVHYLAASDQIRRLIEDDVDFYKGAVRAEEYCFSMSSGVFEEDRVTMLVVAVRLRRLSLEDAQKFAAITVSCAQKYDLLCRHLGMAELTFRKKIIPIAV